MKTITFCDLKIMCISTFGVVNKVLLGHSHVHAFTFGCGCTVVANQHWMVCKSLKYWLSGPLQKKFADPVTKPFRHVLYQSEYLLRGKKIEKHSTIRKIHPSELTVNI